MEISKSLFEIAKSLNKLYYFRFAEQLRGATLSISNNIAEGSGSSSKKDFAHYLNIAHRSTFEVVNILINLHQEGLVDEKQFRLLMENHDHLPRRISNFKKSLLNS